MKLLKSINLSTAVKSLSEDAAVGAVDAGAVASCAMPLFSKLVSRNSPKVTTIKWGKKKPTNVVDKKNSLGLKEAFASLTEAPQGGDSGAMSMNMDGSPASSGKSSSFDTTAVIAKLKGLEDKDRVGSEQNTTSFGLEDENGGIVRVTVAADQAEQFEKSLQAYLAQQEQKGEDVPEIAEVLFKLKDRFDIIHVQWPEVQEDEEEDVNLQGQDGGEEGGQDLDIDGADAQADPNAGMPADGAGDGQVKDLLTQVIDMMKADADARKAEAKAKEAEAKAREADLIAKQVTSKVKQEEQFLDMEQFDKSKKDEEREVKRLAKLARWKHEMGENGDDDESEQEPSDSDLDSFVQSAKQKQPLPAAAPREEEERTTQRPAKVVAQPASKQSPIRGRVHPHDIASFILSRVK